MDIAKSNPNALINPVGKERITVRVPIIPCFADESSQEKTIEELIRMGIDKIDFDIELNRLYFKEYISEATTEIRCQRYIYE